MANEVKVSAGALDRLYEQIDWAKKNKTDVEIGLSDAEAILAALSAPQPSASVDERARELLAREYEHECRPMRAAEIRERGPADDDDKRTIRAIKAALSGGAGHE